jgi:hypothetical protein
MRGAMIDGRLLQVDIIVCVVECSLANTGVDFIIIWSAARRAA